MVNKIYIVGPVASGKTTLARRLAKDFGFPCFELDIIVHKKDYSSESGNSKRPVSERDALLKEAISGEKWIVEDTGRDCFVIAMKKADSIILLEPHALIRKIRIFLRWIKQNLRIEKCAYKPDFKMLKLMYKWTNDFDNGAGTLKTRLIPYNSKITIIKNEKDIMEYINKNFP